MIVAQHIKELRLQKNYSQSYVADELEVSQKTYSNMENGKSILNIVQLRKLASIYNIEIDVIIKKIYETDAEIIYAIKEEYPNIKSQDIYNDINENLPFELIKQLKGRVNDLNKLVDLKDLRIANLIVKIKTLEDRLAS